MSRVIRRHEIRRRRKRQSSLRRLRAKLAKATTHQQIDAVLAKLHKICPWIPDREWMKAQETAAAAHATPAEPQRRAA